MATTVSESNNNITVDATIGVDASTAEPSPETTFPVLTSPLTSFATTTSSTNRPAWNLPSAVVSSLESTVEEQSGNARKKQSFAEIMAEQTQDRIAAQIASGSMDVNLAETQAEQERLFRSLQEGGGIHHDGLACNSDIGLSAEELRMIEQAMQESLQLSQPGPSSSTATACATSAQRDGEEDHLTEKEMEEIEKAIREAEEITEGCCNEKIRKPAPQADSAAET
jgi:hypothetical protein